ncbi:MAG: acyl carrier protein [Candidatus Competibacteraceae bacterium]|nr:acyl carrier protein [Candidatus Competibacteraceae bacterium]
MNQNAIKETVTRLVNEIAPDANVEAVDPDVSFHDQFELDSIDFLRLMLALEKEFNIAIFDFDYPKLSTLRGCENYLMTRLAA